MKLLDKIKDLFTDEEEEFETKEIEVEKEEPAKLPTFMRNKIEEEEKLVNVEIKKEDSISARDTIETKNNSFSFPMDMGEEYETVYTPRNRNVLDERENTKPKEKTSVADLYTKKEEPKPKKFRPTPVISPVYGVLDKNYTKDEVKLQDEDKYEIPRTPRKVDFESVRNKAYGTLIDDIKNNMCENCELYKEVRITKKNGQRVVDDDINLLEDIVDTNLDVTIEEAAENYYDFGVDYEPVKEVKAPSVVSDESIENEVSEDIKIVNHNDEESVAEKIEVKEEIDLPKEIEEDKEIPKRKPVNIKDKKEDLLEDTKEFEKIVKPEENAEEILEKIDNEEEDIPLDLDTEANDIFNLIDSMYEEEEK